MSGVGKLLLGGVRAVGREMTRALLLDPDAHFLARLTVGGTIVAAGGALAMEYEAGRLLDAAKRDLGQYVGPEVYGIQEYADCLRYLKPTELSPRSSWDAFRALCKSLSSLELCAKNIMEASPHEIAFSSGETIRHLFRCTRLVRDCLTICIGRTSFFKSTPVDEASEEALKEYREYIQRECIPPPKIRPGLMGDDYVNAHAQWVEDQWKYWLTIRSAQMAGAVPQVNDDEAGPAVDGVLMRIMQTQEEALEMFYARKVDALASEDIFKGAREAAGLPSMEATLKEARDLMKVDASGRSAAISYMQQLEPHFESRHAPLEWEVEWEKSDEASVLRYEKESSSEGDDDAFDDDNDYDSEDDELD